MTGSDVGRLKQQVGDCWTITFKNIDGRAFSDPRFVWTWGNITGSFAVLESAIVAMGGTIEQSDFQDATSDVKDICICVPCKSLSNPSNSINYVFGPLNGTRTGVLTKKQCDEPQYTEPECIHARILCVGRDNGVTPGSSSNTAGTRPDFIRFNWTFESKGIKVNGQIVGAGQVIGGASGWTSQFTDDTAQQGKAGVDLSTWVPYLNSVYSDRSKYCTAFGSKPKPTWRYAKTTTVDPCALFDDWKLCRTDLPEGTPAEETEYVIHPVLVESEIIKTWRYWKIVDGKKSLQYCKQNADGTFEDTDAPTWQPYQGATPVPIPADCFVPCDQKFGDPIAEDAGSKCSTNIEDGCEIKPAEIDPNTFDVLEPAVAVTTNLLVAISLCEDGSVSTFAYDVDADGNAEPYELPDPNPDGLFFGDCNTLEAFPDPEPLCRPPGSYTGRTFCVETKGKFVLIEKQFAGQAGTVDVSTDLGLPTGSVIATTDASLWTGGAATIMAASSSVSVRFTTAGTQPVCIRVQHGGAIPTDGASDGMISNDGVPYGFTGTITGDGSINQNGNSYNVTSVTDNSQGAINWTSQGPATDASAWTTNGNPLNSVRFWLATFDCVELREWVSDCGTLSGWYDGERQVDITGLVESDCCKDETCCNKGDSKVTADESKEMCVFVDGDPTNCDSENVVEFTRTVTNCVVNGVLVEQTFTDSINVESLGENAIVMSCRRDAENRLLICEEKCYKYTPPKIVRPVKTVKSVKSAVKAVKALSVRKLVARALSAVNKSGETTALAYKPCDTVRVTTCCLCGTTEPIESETTYEIFDAATAVYSPTDPIDYEAEIWFEVPCEPGIEVVDADPCKTTCIVGKSELIISGEGVWSLGGDTVIKINGSTVEPLFAEVRRCLETGAEFAKICGTDSEGNTVEFNATSVSSPTTLDGNLIQGETDVSTEGALTWIVKCDGEEVDAIRNVGCNDDRRDDCLTDIKDSLGCDKCPKTEPGPTTQTDDNATVNFPVTATGGFKDHSTTVTVSDPTGCLAANPTERFSVRYKVDHEAGPHDTHRLYILIASAGIFTSQSASNTGGTVGGSNINIGYASGDPVANARNERWVKLTATAQDWLDGVTFTTGFFGGVGGAFESIFSQSFEVCDDVGTICPDCGDASAAVRAERLEASAAIEISGKDVPSFVGGDSMSLAEFSKRLGEIEKRNQEENFWFKASRRSFDEKPKKLIQPKPESSNG